MNESEMNNKQNAETTSQEPQQSSRRDFMKTSALGGIGVIGGSVLALSPSLALATDFSADDFDMAVGNDLRANVAEEIKTQAAAQHFDETLSLPDQFDSNDEKRYKNDNFYASFTKCLPSNNFGEVTPLAFKQLTRALQKGGQGHFDAIPLDASAARRLENPQNALRFEVSGLDSHATRIAPSFAFRSAQGAAEAGEVYWQALTRDVPFVDYGESTLIADAVTDLNNFSATAGALNGAGQLTSGRIFRGETPGDLNGPFISQFLLREFNFGPSLIEQRYETPSAGVDFMTDVPNWLNVQKGAVPLESVSFDSTRRYIYNNRALAEYVHRDALYQAYLYAALQILGLPGGAAKFDAGNPYFNGSVSNQTAFGSLGGPHILESVSLNSPAWQPENGAPTRRDLSAGEQICPLARTGGDGSLPSGKSDPAQQIYVSGPKHGLKIRITPDLGRIEHLFDTLKFNQWIAVQPCHQRWCS